MDKLEKLKSLIIDNYFSYLRKLERGHPYKHYNHIRNAMFAVRYVEDLELSKADANKIIDRVIIQLTMKQ